MILKLKRRVGLEYACSLACIYNVYIVYICNIYAYIGIGNDKGGPSWYSGIKSICTVLEEESLLPLGKENSGGVSQGSPR